MRMKLLELGAAAGAVVIAANLAAVQFLRSGTPSAYRVDKLGPWLREARRAPRRTDASATLFSVGPLALLPVAAGLARVMKPSVSRTLTVGGLAVAAVANGVGAPLVAAAHRASSRQQGRTLLRRAVDADALFNAALGGALIAFGMGDERAPKLVRGAAVAAGVACLPIVAQSFSGTASRLVSVAGPMWLVAVAGITAHLWHERDERTSAPLEGSEV
jgi:hypothetical protein